DGGGGRRRLRPAGHPGTGQPLERRLAPPAPQPAGSRRRHLPGFSHSCCPGRIRVDAVSDGRRGGRNALLRSQRRALVWSRSPGSRRPQPRQVRGQTLALREREFIEAARSSGARPIKILFGHILPNALGPVIVQATFGVPAAILFEAFLSFLGLGVPPPQPSWGSMAADGLSAIRIAPHMVIAPSIALSLTLMAFNFLGDGLRDALDPRSRR